MQKRRFNLVDVAIILVILIAVAYVGKKLLKPTSQTATVPVVLRVQSTPTPYYAVELAHLVPGSPVNAILGGVAFQVGTLASTGTLPDYIVAPTATGQLVRQADPLERLVVLTVDANATASGGSYLFNGNPLYVGQYLTFNSGTVQVNGIIVDIRRR